MSTLMIFIREGSIQNADAMKAYQETNAKRDRDPNMTPLVAYGATTALEGEAPDGTVILKFPDKAAAEAWYNHPVYQEAITHRMKAAPYRVFMVEGF